MNSGEEPLRLERLLAELSVDLKNLPADLIDSRIAATLKSICDCVGLDYSALAQWDDVAELFVITHSCVADGDVSGRRFKQVDIPWIADKIFRGERGRVVRLAYQSKLPDAARRDVETFCRKGMQFTEFFPLKAGEQILGFLCFGTSRAEREGQEFCFDRLNVVADLFAGALTRYRFGESAPAHSRIQSFLQSDERFQMEIELFPAAVVLVDDKGRIVLANSRATVSFGYELHAMVGQPVEMLIPERFRESHITKYRPEHTMQPLERAVGGKAEFFALRNDGSEFPVDVALTPIHSNGNAMTLIAITDITDRKLLEQAMIDMNVQLLEANEKIRKMKEKLEYENNYLKEEIKLESNHAEIVGQSQAILQVLKSAERVAATDSAVLLLGETGTGKELIARAIHKDSKRQRRAMVTVNCAALPASLVENELFGRERGAYTGALTREIGRFELADRSTIFLDEIGELPLELQSKLLRVLEEGKFERLGSSKTTHVDVRLIAATSRNLEEGVKSGKFREDLFYRLNVFPINVPPLRARKEDIPMLVWHFLHELGGRMGRDIESVDTATMKALQSHSWPGNVRELRNVIERNLIINPGTMFKADLPEKIGDVFVAGGTIEEVERNHISAMLARCAWRIRGPGGAAESLGLKPTTLEARMKKLGIVRKQRVQSA